MKREYCIKFIRVKMQKIGKEDFVRPINSTNADGMIVILVKAQIFWEEDKIIIHGRAG